MLFDLERQITISPVALLSVTKMHFFRNSASLRFRFLSLLYRIRYNCGKQCLFVQVASFACWEVLPIPVDHPKRDGCAFAERTLMDNKKRGGLQLCDITPSLLRPASTDYLLLSLFNFCCCSSIFRN